MAQAPEGTKLLLKGTYNGSDGVLKKGTVIQAKVPVEEFGNAQARDVRQGCTFTSADGICLEGGFEPESAEVIPSFSEQIVTSGTDTYLYQVTVKPIPYSEEENNTGGITIIIGTEFTDK